MRFRKQTTKVDKPNIENNYQKTLAENVHATLEE